MQDTLELLGSAADEPGDPETVPGLHGSPRHEPHHTAPFQPPLFCLGRDVCLVLCVAASSLMQSRSKRAAGLARRIASFLPFAGGCADSLGIFLIFFCSCECLGRVHKSFLTVPVGNFDASSCRRLEGSITAARKRLNLAGVARAPHRQPVASFPLGAHSSDPKGYLSSQRPMVSTTPSSSPKFPWYRNNRCQYRNNQS